MRDVGLVRRIPFVNYTLQVFVAKVSTDDDIDISSDAASFGEFLK